ncbi:uncharacterized protein CDAR_191881 [Caerostris darwini]|uniref:Uncharacterized protein n=1 Tax=Caerostris darwini TaxID=1538125 RepID=A0AAV4PBE0_9ARAC|nr:uncharacterized protein CDAR_191881 [Caerostris darwini]
MSSQFCKLFCLLFLATSVGTAFGDESRAIVDDTVSRQHHEAIQPETDSHEEDYQTSDEGPLVLPVSYHHDMKSILHDSTPSRMGIFKMATLKLEYVAQPLLIALWILIGALTKIATPGYFRKQKDTLRPTPTFAASNGGRIRNEPTSMSAPFMPDK